MSSRGMVAISPRSLRWTGRDGRDSRSRDKFWTAIWNPPLTQWGSLQPEYAARVGVPESDTPHDTQLIIIYPGRQTTVLGKELSELTPSSGNHLSSLYALFWPFLNMHHSEVLKYANLIKSNLCIRLCLLWHFLSTEKLARVAVRYGLYNYLHRDSAILDEKLTDLRAANVSTEKLARVAVRHGLYNYLRRDSAILDEKLTDLRGANVSTKKLARVAVQYGLYNYLCHILDERVEKEIGPAHDRRFICSVQIVIAEGMLFFDGRREVTSKRCREFSSLSNDPEFAGIQVQSYIVPCSNSRMKQTAGDGATWN
ncbi:Ribonuclease 3-like protein 2 [Capsicum chinense]|nr:Ribonuclease 3-like protein 2 [Capsicum chinense]